MSELTMAQKRVLQYLNYFEGGNAADLREDLRPAFAELIELGLIEPFTKYCLTNAGIAALALPSDQLGGGS